ncbi:MAG TPA: hypothetical protein VMU46_09140 [Burkholderiales bacterium]|nr:hypothetical protein [Burkholderiales bacterium]
MGSTLDGKLPTKVEIKRRSSLIMVLMSTIAVFCMSSSAAAPAPVRVTTSFDVKYASAVLHQVSRVYGAGFGAAEINRVNQDIAALKPDQPKTWQFAVQFKGTPQSLEIRALLDDLGMIDLDFSASPDAAPALRTAVDTYLNARGH